MPRQRQVNQLLVEGKNDQHVIWALCQYYQVPESFSVEVPNGNQNEGLEALLRSIPVRLKISGLRSLGIVVDADENLVGRWNAVCHRLREVGYQNLPAEPDVNGFITTPSDAPRVGVWLMPNNQLPGMLETFVAHLIPDGDLLAPQAEAILKEIERNGLHRYRLIYHPKAFIHTWLAWQENPGMPMGQAITAQVLHPNKASAIRFIDWLNRLF